MTNGGDPHEVLAMPVHAAPGPDSRAPIDESCGDPQAADLTHDPPDTQQEAARQGTTASGD